MVGCRSLLESAADVTASLSSRVFSWITSPFRAAAEPAAEESEDSEDNEEKKSEEAEEAEKAEVGCTCVCTDAGSNVLNHHCLYW